MPLSAADHGGNTGMIDLHVHILSGLDDGPRALNESIEMCRMSYRDGVRTIVATPHTLNGVYLNDRATILTKIHELNETLNKCGMQNAECGTKNSRSEIQSSSIDSELRTPNSELRILAGADVRFCEEILLRLDRGEVTTVGDGGRFLSVEFPFQGIPYRAEDILFRLMTRGIIPIITHPERNLEISDRPKRYYEMIRMGCLGQVTAMSLTGRFGQRVRKGVEKLVKERVVHIIASDAHSINERPPVLSEAVRAAEKIVGKEEARKMVSDYPRAILEGRRPNVPEPSHS